jgi:integrase
MNLDEATGRYLIEIEHKTSAINTVNQGGKLLERLGGGTLLAAIDDAKVSDYIAWRRAQRARGKVTRVTGASVNRESELLRRIMNRAQLWGVAVGRVQWKKHRLKDSEERNVTVTADDLTRFFEHLRRDYWPLFQAAQASGLRLKNLTTLTWPQVRWQAGKVAVRQKGDREHSVPIAGHFAAILQAEHDRPDRHPVFVFCYDTQKRFYDRFNKRWLGAGSRQPFSANGWRPIVMRTRLAAGLPDFRFHDQRHLFGNAIYGATRNLKIVQKALGHSNVRSTLRYLRAGDEDVAQAMAGLAAPVPVTLASHKAKGG